MSDFDTRDPELTEIRENREYAELEWDENRKEAKKDRLCVAGFTWEALDPDGQKNREDNKRPFLNLDELNQYINQTVNNIRANPRGIKFAPTGNGANDATAEFYEGYVRECEYRSHAHIVDSNAFDAACCGGIGWERITYKRLNQRSFESDLCIDLVANPDQVLVDPGITWQDSRDMKFLFYIEPWRKKDFIAKFKNAKVRSFDGLSAVVPTWVQEHTLALAEYWEIVPKERVLIGFVVPQTQEIVHLFKDELDADPNIRELLAIAQNLREEEVKDQSVRMRLTNGVEILEMTEWPGRYIPFISCMGKVVYAEMGGKGHGSRRIVLSLVRHPRTSQMLHNYIVTSEVEAMGGIPRSIWLGPKGAFAYPDRWAKSSHEPVDHLEYEPDVLSSNGQVIPVPPGAVQRQPWDPPIQNLLAADEAAKRAIQAGFGISPMPTPYPAQDRRLTGKAMDRLEASGQKGSYHFVDSFELMIERRGVILEDLIPHVLDSARDVAVRRPDDSTVSVRVNDPTAKTPIWTDTDHRVTLSTGPATESQRVEGAEFVDSLIPHIVAIAQASHDPVSAQLLAKSIKLKQLGPIGDEIVDILMPPGQDGKPVDPKMNALMRQNQQLQQQVQQMQQMIQGKVAEKQAETHGKMQIAEMQEQHEDWRASMDREVKLAVAEEMAQAKQQLQDMALFYEERARVGAQIHEQAMGGREAAHALHVAREASAHEAAISVMEHEQALQQGAQQAQIAVQAPQQPADGAVV